jgi:hypothetical protein
MFIQIIKGRNVVSASEVLQFLYIALGELECLLGADGGPRCVRSNKCSPITSLNDRMDTDLLLKGVSWVPKSTWYPVTLLFSGHVSDCYRSVTERERIEVMASAFGSCGG